MNTIGDDERPTDLVLVTQNSAEKPGNNSQRIGLLHNADMDLHPDCGHDVWRRNEALSFSDTESHTILQDDWQEVSNGVCDRCCQAEERSEAPDLEISGTGDIMFDAERCGDGIMAVMLDSGDDELRFLLVQEGDGNALRGALGSLLREVDDCETADEADYDGEDALHDENPCDSVSNIEP